MRRMDSWFAIGGVCVVAMSGALACGGTTASPPPEPPRAVPAVEQEPPLPPLTGEQAASLAYLAWVRDPAGVRLAMRGLEQADSVRVAAARALAEYGSPMADGAKPALLRALASSAGPVRAEIVWALVCVGDRRILDQALQLYGKGQLATVRRLDGGLAFDPVVLGELMDVDDLVSLHRAPSPALRHLAATALSQRADARRFAPLLALSQDSEPSVARVAGAGLALIPDPSARRALLVALASEDEAQREQWLEALRHGAGTRGLVVALDSVADSDQRNVDWHRRNQLWKQIEQLADPSGADALADLLQRKLHPHWSYRAGRALGSVGDLRGVPALARRLGQDTDKIYSDETDYERQLKRNNSEEVEAARMLADLAVVHPHQHALLREQSERFVWAWLNRIPWMNANGVRALSAMESTLHARQLRQWADPDVPLPVEGQQPPMPDEWVMAQTALRYLGTAKNPEDIAIFAKQLQRKPAELDASMKALMGGGIAILGMSLRAVGVGAANGLAEAGDPRGFSLLLAHIEDPLQNDQSRLYACDALAWVSHERDLHRVAQLALEHRSQEPFDTFTRKCLLRALARRPTASVSGPLLELFESDVDPESRHEAARALGKAGLTEEAETRLQAMLSQPTLHPYAALALMLGGAPETAARALASFEDAPPELLAELQELWYRSFDYWSDEDLERGHMFRFVDNALAASRIHVHDAPQDWVKVQLERQFDNLLYDNGPHSLTRVVLRARLRKIALGNGPKRRAQAIRTLELMHEEGVLFELRERPTKVARLAQRAHHRLLTPKVVGPVPDLQRRY